MPKKKSPLIKIKTNKTIPLNIRLSEEIDDLLNRYAQFCSDYYETDVQPKQIAVQFIEYALKNDRLFKDWLKEDHTQAEPVVEQPSSSKQPPEEEPTSKPTEQEKTDNKPKNQPKKTGGQKKDTKATDSKIEEPETDSTEQTGTAHVKNVSAADL